MSTETDGRCLGIEDLAGSASWAEGDPRREHVEHCPRCWARLASFREFEWNVDAPPGARLDEARAAIGEALSREIGVPVVAPRVVEFPERARRRGAGPNWFSAAAALIAAGAIVIVLARGSLFGPRPAVLRGEGASGAMGGAALGLMAPVRTAQGALVLRWHAVPGAQWYRVAFLGADLGEVAALDPTADTTATLTRAGLPAALASGATVRYEVTALADGATLATSRVETVRLP